MFLLNIVLLFAYGLLAINYEKKFIYEHSYDNKINHVNMCLAFGWGILFVCKFVGMVLG